MKKNKMMRVASILLVAVLLTTSIISGTFAKYVTEGSASDSARVAKFGVVITASGSLFDTTYVKKDSGNTPGGTAANDGSDFTALTVESSNTDKLVAPGTKSAEGGLNLSVTGTPEVDVNVKLSVDNVKDVFLGAKNDLPDMTTAVTTDKFNNEAVYNPIKYTLTGNYLKSASLDLSSIAGLDISKKADNGAVTGTLAQIQQVLAKINGTNGIYVDAGKNLATEIGSFTLTWEWEFESTGNEDAKKLRDQQDTLLGDIAASALASSTRATEVTLDSVQLTEGTDYSIDAGISLTITVTQVD